MGGNGGCNAKRLGFARVTSKPDHRKWFVPEVLQTSELDCGPASLHSLLMGFGIPSDYADLRYACRTSVDGTSIDRMEDVANTLGLNVSQLLLPYDHIKLPESESIPAIVATVQPGGWVHFIVVWRKHWKFLQINDPAVGRVWRSETWLQNNLYKHRLLVSADTAYDWFTSDTFLAPLQYRLRTIGLTQDQATALTHEAESQGQWWPMAVLDAVTRLMEQFVRTKAIPLDNVAVFINRLTEELKANPEQPERVVPERYWSAKAQPDGQIELLGGIILHVDGIADKISEAKPLARNETEEQPRAEQIVLREMWRARRPHILLSLLMLGLVSIATALQPLFLKGLSHRGDFLISVEDSNAVLIEFSIFFGIILLLDCIGIAITFGLGRWLDVWMHMKLLERLPLLRNTYFQTRLTSDLAHRLSELWRLRALPLILADIFYIIFDIISITVGVILLFPSGSIWILLIALLMPSVALLVSPWMSEHDARLQTHIGALSRISLDALRGHAPLKAHHAEAPMRLEHERLVVDWAGTLSVSYWTYLLAVGVMTGMGVAGIILLMTQYIHTTNSTNILLVLFWVLQFPDLANNLMTLIKDIPVQHNLLLRLFEILQSPINPIAQMEISGSTPLSGRSEHGIRLAARGIQVSLNGSNLLSDINLELQPGEHVAVVGPSGSGKSTLMGLFMGMYDISEGRLDVDGMQCDVKQYVRLRQETAWVNPSVQVWNQSLRDNLMYGNPSLEDHQIDAALDWAILRPLVERLPDGLKSVLGEGGGMVSGGEGQRIRLARAFLRSGVRLALLDEPFRGLDRDLREILIERVRQHWKAATLIMVSHDIEQSAQFSRVLVVEGGKIVEDGEPLLLLMDEGSRYRALWNAEQEARLSVWESAQWRRWRMVDRAPQETERA